MGYNYVVNPVIGLTINCPHFYLLVGQTMLQLEQDVSKKTGKRDPATPSPKIAAYYRQTIEDYQTWSRQGYMHFGYWKPWINPFDRNAMLEAMNDLVFQTLQIDDQSELRIADLGCGTGAVSRYGARRHPKHQWTAVTICPEQVAYGQAQFDSTELPNMQILQANYCGLPFDDNSFDAAFFLESMCHADNELDPLVEAARIIKPGGRLVVVDGMMRHPAEQTPRYAQSLANKVGQSWAVGQFHRVPDFEAAADQAGFSIESKREIGWQIVPCVAHSPLLVAWHTARLMLTGKWTAWKRKHMIGCALGVMLGAVRTQFGYYIYGLRKR